MNIFAGLILNRKNPNNTPHTIATIVVVKYRPDTNVITPKTPKIMVMSHPASPSSPSVMLIALTIDIVITKVEIGYRIHKSM